MADRVRCRAAQCRGRRWSGTSGAPWPQPGAAAAFIRVDYIGYIGSPVSRSGLVESTATGERRRACSHAVRQLRHSRAEDLRVVRRARVCRTRSRDPAHTQTVLTEGLTLDERLIRRLVCTRLWPDGLAGLRNVDLLRFRAEWHSGVCAARRLHRLEAAGPRFDVLHFHRQAAAYASLDRMRRTPSIVSIDCTPAVRARCRGHNIRTAHLRAERPPRRRGLSRGPTHHCHFGVGRGMHPPRVPGLHDRRGRPAEPGHARGL